MFYGARKTYNISGSGSIFKPKQENKKKSLIVTVIIRYADNIDAYLEDLGVILTWQQQELLDAYKDGETNIAVKAGKGPGKTFITTLVASHWLMTHPWGMLVVTAPTFRQCKEVWLSQLEKIILAPSANPIFRRIFRIEGKGIGILHYKKSVWGGQLITARDERAAQGIHNKYLFIIEEEASGVPAGISRALETTITNNKATYVYIRIGNPNTRDNAFYNCFYRDASNKWVKLTWNAEQTPESEFFSHRSNEELAEEFGKDSDVYRVSVLGEFPENSANCLISEEELLKCCTENALDNAIEMADFTKQIGIDLARSGDRNAIVVRCGNVVVERWSGNVEPIECLDRAIMMQENLGWSDEEVVYVIDTAGMGEGLSALMSHASRRNKRVHEFYTQNTAYDSDRYSNKMTEAWCHFNKEVRKNRIHLGEKLDNRTLVQLVMREYLILDNGKIEIESKKVYKKRLADLENGEMGKSPDEADALMMAFYPHAADTCRFAAA